MTAQLRTALFVGDLSPGSTGLQRFLVLQDLGFQTVGVDPLGTWSAGGISGIIDRVSSRLFRMGFTDVKLPDTGGVNGRIQAYLKCASFDLFWIDKGLRVSVPTFECIRESNPRAPIIGYSLDNMLKRHNTSRQFLASLPYYDLFVTTKSFSVEPLKRLGCRHVVFQDNSFDAATHYPHSPVPERFKDLAGRVGFIGTWERGREQSLINLASQSVPITVFGRGWQGRKRWSSPFLDIRGEALMGRAYSEALSAFAINLCFLRKQNDDLQTTRSMEIPACGGFMLAERTTEHSRLFREGEEADFFSSEEELAEKTSFYLSHPEVRQRIAAAGRQRCITSSYSYTDRIRQILSTIET